MKYNKSLMGDLQTYNLQEKIELASNEVDLNYNGYDVQNPKSVFTQVGYAAHVNRVLFWITSKRNDYVRSSFKGGVIYDILGKLATESNLEYWEKNILQRFNMEFSNDLTLLSVKLSTDKNKRYLKINMVVQDKMSNHTFTVNTEARL